MTDTIPLADTSEMIGVHDVFREALVHAPDLIGRVEPGDTERAAVVASYYDNVLRLLHVHHEGEDALLTPRLLDRCAAAERATVERTAAQHAPVAETLEHAHSALASWRDAPDEGSAATVLAVLAELRAALLIHLDDEERLVLPLAGRHITAAEWGELPGHALQHFSGDKPWLILGLLQEQMTEAQLAQLQAHMPPPVLAAWNESGRDLFNAYRAQLRG